MHMTAGAIITHRTSRAIIATHYLGTHKRAIDYSDRNAEGHAKTAMELVEKLAGEWCKKNGQIEWINAPFCGQWVAGDMPKGDSYAFSYAGETNRLSAIEPRGFVQNCEANGKPKR